MLNANVVQAEFFHINMAAKDLDAVLRQCIERRAFGSPIKTTVRYYDEAGSVSRAVIAHTHMKELERAIWEDIARIDAEKKALAEQGISWKQNTARAWKHFVLSIRFKRLCKRADDHLRSSRGLEKRANTLAKEQLRAIAQTRSSDIAIECDDHRFRLAQPNELHELCEAIDASFAAWLFIFKPNTLLADKNTRVAALQ